MKTYRILYADNDLDALKITTEYLTGLGYIVEVADSPSTTIEKLRKFVFDLAILDLRLSDNEDPSDKSGLEIAKTEARGTPKIIYTAFPSLADAKEAMRMDMHEFPPAVDFLDKGTGLFGLKEAIANSIAKDINSQGDLNLTWPTKGICSIGQLATTLDPNLEIIEFSQLTGELEMVFRQLFKNYEQVSISRLLWTERFRCCLALHAYHHDVEDHYLLTLGQLDAIHKEIGLFRSTISLTKSINSLSVVDKKDSLHVAAILWSIRGIDIDRTQNMADYIRDGTGKQIQNVINQLFSSFQAIWYQQSVGKGKNDPFTSKTFWDYVGVNISEVTRLSLQQKIEAIVEDSFSRNIFPLHINAKGIEIDLHDGKTESLPNPLDLLFDEHGLPSTGGLTTTIAGLTNLESVLVDENEQCWLTDYSQIRTAVVFRDFAALEIYVRCNLAESTDVFSALVFEEQMLETTSLAANVSARYVIPSHRNILQAIISTRNSAAKIFGDQITLYFLTLLFMAAKGLIDLPLHVRLSKPELISYVYRLLFMAKLSQYIIKNQSNKPIDTGAENLDRLKIILDEEQRRVWIGKTEKQLSHTEFDILLFLFKKNGAVCKREEILEHVLKYSGGLDKSAKNLINTHVNRIRNQIEPNPESPVFVLTVRNEGYRLDLSA